MKKKNTIEAGKVRFHARPQYRHGALLGAFILAVTAVPVFAEAPVHDNKEVIEEQQAVESEIEMTENKAPEKETADKEIIEYRIDTTVTAPAEEITEGYEKQPEYIVKLHNTGTGALTQVKALPQQSQTSFFELDEQKQQLPLFELDEEGNQVLLQELKSLEPGKEVFMKVLLPLGLKAGDYTEHLKLEAAELSEAVDVLLEYTVVPGKKEESGVPKEPLPVKEEKKPELKITSRTSGRFVGETYYTAEPMVYELSVKPREPENGQSVSGIEKVTYTFGGRTETVPVKDGKAQITLPEECSGKISFWCEDQEGKKSEILEESVTAEKSEPVISYTSIESETGDSDITRVTMEEKGDVKSGLDEYTCYLDDTLFLGKNEDVVESTGSNNAPLSVSFDIPLKDDKIHSVKVKVKDYAGNTEEKTFNVKAVPKEVVSVALPTSFQISVLPVANSSNGEIFGEDIVVSNQSDFPVKVMLTKTMVDIKHDIPKSAVIQKKLLTQEAGEKAYDLSKEDMIKDCKLDLHLLTADKKVSVIPLKEGETQEVTEFTLAAHSEKTDVKKLMADKSEKQVENPDYAIVKVRGKINKGTELMWQDGDIGVSLAFDFKKIK